MLFNWILDKIPGIRDIDVNTDMLQEKFGVFGEPMIIGTVIGLVIGVLAGYDVTGVLQLAVSLGAVLVLIPRMASLLMEACCPSPTPQWQRRSDKSSGQGIGHTGQKASGRR